MEDTHAQKKNEHEEKQKLINSLKVCADIRRMRFSILGLSIGGVSAIGKGKIRAGSTQ